jgi:hypothetical protein
MASTTSSGDWPSNAADGSGPVGAPPKPETVPSTAPASTAPGQRTFSDRLPRPWLFPLLAFGATWVLILASWQFANFHYHATHGWYWYIWYKDSGYYESIARQWYHTRLSTLGVPISTAFFPVFPALIWLASLVTFGNWHVAGLIATVISGAAACLSVWALAARVRDRWLADRAVLLFCVFPGAMTLGMIYAEPLGVALTACCLLAALNRKWVLSGLLALVATGEHPTLIVLAPALGIVALHAIWTRRDWRSLIAPALAPWGMIGYFLWIGTWFHDYTFWFTVERKGWGQQIDWGKRTFQLLTWTGKDMGQHTDFYLMCDIMFWVLLIGTVLMLAARVPLPVSAFTLLLFLNAAISNGAGPRPRIAWPALGIYLGAAAKLPRWLYWPVLAVSAAGLFFIIGWWPDHKFAPPP